MPPDSREASLPLQPDVVDMPDVPDRDELPETEPAAGGGLRSFLGHPRGLYALFFTEMWERFSFYSMLALLALYIKNELGFRSGRASDITTWYLSLVYFTPFLGGLIADRVTGYIRAITLGGLLMMAGHIVLAFDRRESVSHVCLFTALGLLIAGNGLFKPNISTMVGNLYGPNDPRRDQGFTIFYMGINLGAALAPMAASFFRSSSVGLLRKYAGVSLPEGAGWHIAFGSAGVGMFFSLVIFTLFRGRFASPASLVKPPTATNSEGLSAEPESDRALLIGQWFNMGAVTFALAWLLLGPLIPWPEPIRGIGLWPTKILNFATIWLIIEAVTVVIFLSGGDLASANAAKLKAVFVIVAMFWMAFHQNSVTLTFFAEQHTAPPTTPPLNKLLAAPEQYQAINPVFILLFSPVMVWLWGWLRSKRLEPTSVTKMILAMFVTGMAYALMVGAGKAGGDAGKVSAGWLIGCYALLTVAELWLSPVGLSLTSRIAPAKYKGLWMGFWFLATAVGNKLVHVIGGYWEQYPPSQLFLILVLSSVGAAVALDYILINLRRFGPPSTEA